MCKVSFIYCDIMGWPIGYETDTKKVFYKWHDGKIVGRDTFYK